jgi:catechol 2,3-dioxygenase-like lactoylglutathione lyase family enzyme
MAVTEFLMFTATTPDAAALAESWRQVSDYQVVASDPSEAPLLDLWAVPPGSHESSVVLAAPGAHRGMLRLVETDVPVPEELPATRLGPFGFEFFSRDVDEVYDRLIADGTFRPLSAPRDYDMSAIGSGIGRSFAARGPGGVWMLLTTMKSVPPPRPLPTVPELVGPVINMPVAASDREQAVAFWNGLLGVPIRFDGELADPEVNSVILLPPDRAFYCTVFSVGDGRMAEHHFHPSGSLAPDARPSNRLRPGPAAYTLLVDDLDLVVAAASADDRVVRGPFRVNGAPYGGRRVAAIVGPHGELVELVDGADGA